MVHPIRGRFSPFLGQSCMVLVTETCRSPPRKWCWTGRFIISYRSSPAWGGNQAHISTHSPLLVAIVCRRLPNFLVYNYQQRTGSFRSTTLYVYDSTYTIQTFDIKCSGHPADHSLGCIQDRATTPHIIPPRYGFLCLQQRGALARGQRTHEDRLRHIHDIHMDRLASHDGHTHDEFLVGDATQTEQRHPERVHQRRGSLRHRRRRALPERAASSAPLGGGLAGKTPAATRCCNHAATKRLQASGQEAWQVAELNRTGRDLITMLSRCGPSHHYVVID